MKEAKFKRKCIGCNELKSKDDLLKITKEAGSGLVIINPASTQVGRSAYICKNEKCVEAAFKKGKFFKILKVKADDSIKVKIKEFLT